MNNCGGHEGISTRQSSHIVEPMIGHSLAVVLFEVLGVVAEETSVTTKQLMWGHSGRVWLNSSQYLGWWILRNVFLVELLIVVSVCGCAPGRDPRCWNEALRNHTHAVRYTAELDVHDCRHTHIRARTDMVQTVTLSYFSEQKPQRLPFVPCVLRSETMI